MRLLGLYLGRHDSNATLVDDGAVRYFKSERMLGLKHHRAPLDWVAEICETVDFVPEAVVFSDGDRNGLGVCERASLWQKVPSLPIFAPTTPTYCVDHHLAHILSAWPLVPIEDVDYGVVIDGKGDHMVRVSVLGKPGAAQPVPLLRSTDHAFCLVFDCIGAGMGLSGGELDFAGKVMGAHAYGVVDQEYVARHHRDEIRRNPLWLVDRVPWRGSRPSEHSGFFDFHDDSFRSWLASVHRLLEEFVLDTFTELVPGDATVVYAGGAAQNTVINERIFHHYPQLVIPPHCYDGGLSLGCVELLRTRLELPAFNAGGFPFWQSDPHGGFATSRTVERVARHLADGKIVGWFQGRGEVGPRALGHRSILLDGSRPDGKDYLNATVKHREHWRPYAGALLEATMGEVVESSAPSPYMLRAIRVHEAARSSAPAIVHVDGTSRVQSVAADEPEIASFAQLIAVTQELTGSPAVLNTSMNGNGQPIVSTPEQALDLWRTTPMDVLCIGDSLWEK